MIIRVLESTYKEEDNMEKIVMCNEDCIQTMKYLVGGGWKVDLVIADPPYLMKSHTDYKKDKSHRFCKPIMNSHNPVLIKNMIKYVYRLLDDDSAFYCFCNSNHVDFFKKEIEKYFKVKNILIWVKNNHTAGDLKGAYGKKTEFIIYAVKGRHELNGKRDTDVLYYDRVGNGDRLHQNQKPLELIEYLIGKSSYPKDVVLDPFMGSGTTGVACQNMNRSFIGVELDEYYYDVACKRLKRNKHRKEIEKG